MFRPTAFAQISVVHAADDGAEAERDEFADFQFMRNQFSVDRKNPTQPDPGQIILAPAPEVFEKNIAKRATGHAARLVRQQARGHFLLIFLVGTALADEDFFQRQTDGLRLGVEQFEPDTVHGDALKMFVARRQQRDHLVTLIAQNAIQRER